MSEKHEDASVAAARFLKQHPEVWKAWLPADVVAKVSSSL
ncbi:hypothetical protein ALQ20_200017 [Pseudomonas syringae pv. atrofaciens]|nr:hypothetical protein ALQ20_200017 [Pseudomonas syringae pv. atrofaciens]